MSMLSRVAERVYWLGRYLERIENTARLVSVYGNVLFDLPRPAELVWASLIAITGSGEDFAKRYASADEHSVVCFYLTDRANPASIVNSSDNARENARTVREMVPSSIWGGINDLRIFLHDKADSALARRGRDVFLGRVIESCQYLVGCMVGSMSRDAAYHFLRAGRYLERADMTSRIVDVDTANVFPWGTGGRDGSGTRRDSDPYESILWLNVLRSLNALQMYRRLVPDRICAEEVVAFLLQDEGFPRTVANCLQALHSCLQHLPRNEAAVSTVTQAIEHVAQADVAVLLRDDGVHHFIDQMPIEFNVLYAVVSASWFEPQA